MLQLRQTSIQLDPNVSATLSQETSCDWRSRVSEPILLIKSSYELYGKFLNAGNGKFTVDAGSTAHLYSENIYSFSTLRAIIYSLKAMTLDRAESAFGGRSNQHIMW